MDQQNHPYVPLQRPGQEMTPVGPPPPQPAQPYTYAAPPSQPAYPQPPPYNPNADKVTNNPPPVGYPTQGHENHQTGIDECCAPCDDRACRCCEQDMKADDQNIISWILCGVGCFFVCAWFAGMVFVCRGRTALSKVAGALSLTGLILTALIIIIYLIIIIVAINNSTA